MQRIGLQGCHRGIMDMNGILVWILIGYWWDIVLHNQQYDILECVWKLDMTVSSPRKKWVVTLCSYKQRLLGNTLWQFNIAMENSPFSSIIYS